MDLGPCWGSMGRGLKGSPCAAERISPSITQLDSIRKVACPLRPKSRPKRTRTHTHAQAPYQPTRPCQPKRLRWTSQRHMPRTLSACRLGASHGLAWRRPRTVPRGPPQRREEARLVSAARTRRGQLLGQQVPQMQAKKSRALRPCQMGSARARSAWRIWKLSVRVESGLSACRSKQTPPTNQDGAAAAAPKSARCASRRISPSRSARDPQICAAPVNAGGPSPTMRCAGMSTRRLCTGSGTRGHLRATTCCACALRALS